MQELSLNILDIAENSVKAGASLITVAVCYRPAADRLTVTITDDGCHLILCAQQCPRPRHAQRHGHGIRGVPGHERVVYALVGLGKARQSAVLTEGIELLPASGDDLVRVALMAYVKNEPVLFCVVYPVYRDGKFYRPEVRREVSAGFCDILYFKFSQLITQLRKLLPVKLLYVCG